MGIVSPEMEVACTEMDLGCPDMGIVNPEMEIACPEMDLGCPEMAIVNPDMEIACPEMDIGCPEMWIGYPEMSPKSFCNDAVSKLCMRLVVIGPRFVCMIHITKNYKKSMLFYTFH